MKTGAEMTSETLHRLATLATADMLENLGEFLEATGVLEAARQAFIQAVELGSLTAMVQLALSALEEGETDKAEDLARQAIAGGEFGAYITLGNILAARGRNDDAAAAYNSARDQGYIEAFANLAELALEVGQSADAEAYYLAGVDAGDTLAMRNFGIYLMQLGRLDEALPHLQRSTGERPDAWFDLGNLRVIREEYVDAAFAYGRGIAFGDSRCHMALADILADHLGDREEAERQYQAAIRSGDHLALFNYGLFLLEDQRTEDAERSLNVAACLGQADAWHELGTLHAKRGNLDQARAFLVEAVALGDEDAADELSAIKSGN